MSPRRGVLRRVALTGLLTVLWLLGTALPAHAHAQLIGSSPAAGEVVQRAPTTAELRFDEPVTVVPDGVRLIEPGGAERALPALGRDAAVDVTLPVDLADGGYALAYRVVSADGHPVSGVIAFSIGAAAPAPDAALDAADPAVEAVVAASSAAQYAGLLLFAGLVIFAALVGPGDVLGRWPVRALALGSVASVLLVPASALRGGGLGLARVVEPVAWWPLVSVETVLAAVVVPVVGAAVLALRGGSGRRRDEAAALALVPLVTPALVGHTRTAQPSWLMIAADLGHLVAGAVWVGGLAGLLLTLARRRADPRSGDATRAEWLAAVVGRFSRLALVAVLLLALSGSTMALLVLPDPAALLESAYGRTLLVKLGVLTVPLVIAGWNRFRLLPLIRSRPDRRAQWRTLHRTLGYEAAALVAVIVVTGVLTNRSPIVDDRAATVPAATTVLQAEGQGLSVTASMPAGVIGTNTLTLRLSYQGHPVGAAPVTVAAWLPARRLGPIAATVTRAGDAYLAVVDLPTAGTYRIDVSARVDEFTKPIVSFTLPVG